MVCISELALHLQRGNCTWRAIVSPNFAKKLLEENFNSALMEEFLKSAKKVNGISGFDKGIILVNEDEKKIISAQVAFGLETLENLSESWEYIEAGIYEKIKAIEP